MHYLLIDSSYLQYRSYFAYPTLANSKNQPLGAIYGFIKSILSFSKTYKPDFIVFAKDLPSPTFRDEMYDQYKAGRQPTPAELIEQIKEIHSFLEITGASIMAKAGYEADDMIASATFQLIYNPNQAQINKIKQEYNTDLENTDLVLLNSHSDLQNQTTNQVTIFTGDRDLYQLLAMPNVNMLISDRFGGTKLFGYDDFVEKYELSPAQWLDYKAMVGDGSDNIKGIPGVGPKTATTLLRQFGSLAHIYDSLGIDFIQSLGNDISYTNHKTEPLDTGAKMATTLAPKMATKLIENLENVILSYRLSKLAFPVVDIQNQIWDLSKALDKFQEWEFHSILKELKLPDKSLKAEDIQSSLF